MKRSLSIRLESWPTKVPFRISRHVWSEFPCLVCEIEEGGILGRGEGMGVQYLGETIESAIDNGQDYQDKGYRYSFDMLGEAALTQADADRYHLAYADAITELAGYCNSKDVRLNPGISVKLSALYPRYETLQKATVMQQLCHRIVPPEVIQSDPRWSTK